MRLRSSPRRLSHPRIGFACLLALVLGGCASDKMPKFGPLAPDATNQLLPFLRDGVTTKAECVARLGEAPFVYCKGTALIYRMVYGQVVDNPSGFSFHELVLVFDENGLLRRHALVQKPGYYLANP